MLFLNLAELLNKRILKARETYLQRLSSGSIKDYSDYREIYGRVDMCRLLLAEIDYCLKQLENGDKTNDNKREEA